MTRTRVWLVVGLGALALAAAAALPGIRRIAGDPGVPTVTVERGDFVRKVGAEGNLEAETATQLLAPPGMMGPARIAVLAPDGSRVEEGDVVVRFDPTDMEQMLREGRAGQKSSNSKIRQRELEDETKLENLERDAAIAERELDYSREFQNTDSDLFSRSQIIESGIDEKLATHRKDHAEQVRGITEQLSKVELDLLAIERKKAELKIQRAESGLDKLELTAPHGGIFVLKEQWGRKPQVGMTVWMGNPVAEIPQLDAMEGKIYVLEADAGGLKEGLEAEVVLESHPEGVYKATVKRVDALPKRRQRQVPVQYFEVTLELEQTDPELMKPGQRIFATLFLDERDDVLTVPREALFDEEGKKIAYRRNGSGFEPVEIETGPAALGRVVIESGLEEGDRVALRDPTRSIEEKPSGPGAAPGASPQVAGAG